MIAEHIGAAWEAGLASFRSDFQESEAALAQVIDLAQSEFVERASPVESDPRFATDAPRFARYLIAKYVLAFMKSRPAPLPPKRPASEDAWDRVLDRHCR